MRGKKELKKLFDEGVLRGKLSKDIDKEREITTEEREYMYKDR